MNGLLATTFLSLVGACFGAIAGSFLNVVIHRVPRLIDSHDGDVSVSQYLAGLSWPGSHCTQCGHHIAWHDNIPVLSYVLLRGRCRFCGESYGRRYLVVEMLAALAFAYCLATLGMTAKAFLASWFLAALIALTIIDLEEQLLPDIVLAPLFCLGVIFQTLYGTGIATASTGAAAGFASLWLIREGYRLYSGIEGMGYGDVKFAGALGAWLGITALPAMFAIAFVSGLAISVPLLLIGRIGRQVAVPFGPFLALGGGTLFLLPNLAQLLAALFAVP